MQRVKIAFVSQPMQDVVPRAQGSSSAIWTDRVMQAFAGRDAQFVVYSRSTERRPDVEVHEGVEYRRVSTRWDERLGKAAKLAERLAGHPWPRRPFFASGLSYGSYARQIARDLQGQGVDLVHIHNFSQFAPVIRAQNPGVKILLHMQCDWLDQLDRQLVAQRLRAVDVVLGCSEHVTGAIRCRFPEAAGRCYTVANGVELERFAAAPAEPPAGPPRLLFVGRISPEKGTHLLLDAFRELAAQRPDVVLDLVGPVASAPYEYMVLLSDDPHVAGLERFYQGRLRRDGYLPALQAAVPEGLRRRVNFVGPVPHGRIARHFQQADIVVNPSLTEAFGMSLVEAMASRKPIVATRVGGMPEIVLEEESGLLVPPDAGALAAAILRLLDDPELRRQMGERGYQRAAAHYDWPIVAGELRRLYLQAIAQGSQD